MSASNNLEFREAAHRTVRGDDAEVKRLVDVAAHGAMCCLAELEVVGRGHHYPPTVGMPR